MIKHNVSVILEDGIKVTRNALTLHVDILGRYTITNGKIKVSNLRCCDLVNAIKIMRKGL